jgi:hypothetical protein
MKAWGGGGAEVTEVTDIKTQTCSYVKHEFNEVL